MLEILLFDLNPFVLEGFHCLGQVRRVPQDNCHHHQIQSTGSIALVFVGTISYYATDGDAEYVSGLPMRACSSEPAPVHSSRQED